MASSKSYGLYLGLGLFVILFSQVFAHTLTEADKAADPERKMVLDRRINMQKLMRAIHYLESRREQGRKVTLMVPPARTVHQQDYVEGEGEEFDVIPNVKPSGVDWKAFPAAAYPWLKKDGAKTKTVPGNGNRRLLEKFGEEEITKDGAYLCFFVFFYFFANSKKNILIDIEKGTIYF
ncbi:uncharacterized protein LOC130724136 [Lotus japonicus]|uniref:uncharacterized protein LOC130724136 n=1 Tax=Lotus japonicus TaxID=34305 RepID=UPI00258CE082|nr:uncharacterized protein LOC130724136 [Lotus japonicus]